MIDRRDFANALGLGLLGTPILAQAQPAQRPAVVGVLQTGTARGGHATALAKGLGELGYVEGRNLALEFRFTGGKQAALAAFVAEFVALQVDVIYAVGPANVTAAWEATGTIPIVAFDLETDPVQVGWAHSLARPGGNVTGLFVDVPALAGKWVELLHAAAPAVRRIGLLWDTTAGSSQLAAAKAAAQGLGIEFHVIEVRSREGLEQALRAGTAAGIRAFVMLGSPELSTATPLRRIAGFAADKQLPAISPFRWFADAGGLMSYGPNLEDFYARAASFIARILRGAKPGELAIELPTKFELVLNLKAAKALGLTLPQSLLLRADAVIQ